MMEHELSLEIIKQWLTDADCAVRTAAMNACQGKDIPLEIIKHGLTDADCDVRTAAMNACKINGTPIPIIRSIEPPDLVYKKCVCGIIVVAEIPKDAQIRGTITGKCRANKAVIKEIIGDICGEPVGISKHDLRTFYYKDDIVEILDFDYSNEECSTGFHFFCTREKAEAY